MTTSLEPVPAASWQAGQFPEGQVVEFVWKGEAIVGTVGMVGNGSTSSPPGDPLLRVDVAGREPIFIRASRIEPPSIRCSSCSSRLAESRPGVLLHHDDGSHTFKPADNDGGAE